MGGVLVGFAVIGVVILVGYIVGRIGIVGPDGARVMSRIAFFVTNPALLFTVLADADLHILFSSFVVVALLAAVACAALYVLASRLFFRRPVAETTIGALGASYVNANNIGIPVAVYVLGDPQYVAPVLLLQLLLFAPTGLTVLDISSSAGRVSVGSILTQPLRNPMIIASALGVVVAVTGVALPDAVYAPFEVLGGAAVPLVLMSFGMSLHGSKPFRAGTGRKEIAASSLLKAVVMPIVAYLLARFVFGLDGVQLFAAVVLAALPTAQNIFNFASRYERGEAVARDTVLITTLLAVPVLLVVAALLAP
ncbi:AEC family transporter [Compostimonas suwonensis]|uniref:AEC family transporter n=1 Tax=Compostimonas suwonensis TaxID=1048394 RepID=A0A2M9C4L7_9MICO|nr:AEC family transporter [Compostimonas suwonensis]PJJ65439.1 hypothetical protein CLV54_0472 [Compostimonas suwonensis]